MKLMRRFCYALLLGGLTATAVLAQSADETALQTADGPLALHPVEHASFVMHWNGHTIYVDPVGAAQQYDGLGAPDLVLITHAHGDHLSPDTLAALDTQNAIVVMPQSVADKLDTEYGKSRLIMANDDSVDELGLNIHAVPMYNLPESPDAYHPKGWGNGYVLTLGGKRVYIAGDTEGVAETRSLENIDLAFLCMNLPYTMDVEQAADTVLDFKPAIVYPYHYRGQDTEQFKARVEAGDADIDVRLRNWYPG
ncbi:MBL fold metallo-hydrolase [Salinisphaera aquimarina]|uniref:MBL fold metallo-hydrolase n=1 Tax=Salinisphaera aquimarina TaxID=2094031 RepID=A0ABV7ER22_9GAMM